MRDTFNHGSYAQEDSGDRRGQGDNQGACAEIVTLVLLLVEQTVRRNGTPPLNMDQPNNSDILGNRRS